MKTFVRTILFCFIIISTLFSAQKSKIITTKSSAWKNPVEMFAYCNSNNVDLIVDKDFTLTSRVESSINISGNGTIFINSDDAAAGIDFIRNKKFASIPLKTAMKIGKKYNLALKNVGIYISSTDVLTDRMKNKPYLKNEFVVSDNKGNFVIPVVNDYSKSTTEIQYAPISEQRIIRDVQFKIIGTGRLENRIAFLRNYRDQLLIDNIIITNHTGQQLQVGIENNENYNTTFKNSKIVGFNKIGSGYGVANYSSANFSMENMDISECIHAYTGRNTKNVTILGGTFSDGIDDHWTNNFVVENVTINASAGSAGFQFSGSNINIKNSKVLGNARFYFAIRTDTPYLKGTVNIINPTFITNLKDDIYLFSFTSPYLVLENNFIGKISYPDNLNIVNPVIESSAEKNNIIFLPPINKEFFGIGKITLNGVAKIASKNDQAQLYAIVYVKQDDFQINTTEIIANAFSVNTNISNSYLLYLDVLNSFNHLPKLYIENNKGWQYMKIPKNYNFLVSFKNNSDLQLKQ